MQPSLFDPERPEPLPRPRQRQEASGPVRYTPYRVRFRVHCADCDQVIYEALREGRLDAPQPRQAVWKRIQGDQQLPLCSEHKAQRVTDEQLADLNGG